MNGLKRFWELSRGPKYAKCPACGDYLRRWPSLLWKAIEMPIWYAFAFLALIPLSLPDGWKALLILGFAYPWSIAYRRLYRAYWMWRHPLRCERGGHVEPLQNPAP